MGCQCLWLAESLSRIMDLKPGMRVLDLGCGKVPVQMEDGWGPDIYYVHSLDWLRWYFEKMKLFDVESADDLGGDGVRVTKQWASIMEKHDGLPKRNDAVEQNGCEAQRRAGG